VDKYKSVPTTGTLLYLRDKNGIDMMTIGKGGINMKNKKYIFSLFVIA